MRKSLILLATCWIFISLHNVSAAQQTLAIDYLVGESNISGIRLGYRPFTIEVTRLPYIGMVDLYWELSANIWEYGEHNHHQTNFVMAISPVIGQTFYHIKQRYPLRWEFGIGISLVNDTSFAGKDIGSHYQFEDRLGLAMDFGEQLQQSFALRYMHYSNGGLNSKNPGMDFLNVAYTHNF